MKNTILSLLLFISFVSQAQTIKEYELEYNLSDFTFTTDENNLTVISSIQNDFILKEDSSLPALPYFYINVLISEGKIQNYHSFIESVQIIKKGIILSTNPLIVPTNIVSTQQNNTRQPNYSNLKYPDNNIELISTNRMGDYTYASFELCPFIYNAKTKELSFISKIRLAINLSEDIALKSEETSKLKNKQILL